MVRGNAAEYGDREDQYKDRQIQGGDQSVSLKQHWTMVEMVKQWQEIY